MSPWLCTWLLFPLSSFCLLQNWFTVHIKVHLVHLSYYSCSPSVTPAVCALLLGPARPSAPWFAPLCNIVICHKSLSFTRPALVTGHIPVMYNMQCKWNLCSVPVEFFFTEVLPLSEVLTRHPCPSGSLQILGKSCFCFKSHTFAQEKTLTTPKSEAFA